MKNKQISLSSPEHLANIFHSNNSKISWLKPFHKFSIIIASILIFIIKLLRPLLGPQGVCPFTIGCTEYAIMELESNSLLPALVNISKRLLMCNPIYLYFKR